MKYFVIVLSLGIIILGGCSSEDKDNPISPTLESGKIQLTIDKANAPSDVVTVDAILTRGGYDPITGTLSLLSDSTADILLEEIPAGVWHLKVDAKDNEGVILYTGDTEVEIFAGFVTQVNLTLNPTGEGVGSIYIYVTWGFSNISWIDYAFNPILHSSGDFWEIEGVAQPKILLENNLYKMYYAGYAGAGFTYVAYAESEDGLNWTRPIPNPILSPGDPGSWDSYATIAGAIINDEGIYKMYYVGWANTDDNWNIGLATSVDGIHWEKYPTPVLQGTSGWEYQIVPSSVIKVNGTYFLYYYGRNLPNYNIGLATSTDGIDWVKYTNNPIVTPDKLWEETGVFHASVIITDTQIEMIYMNSASDGFGFAYSSDGMNWTKDNSNPFFTRENTANGWAANKIAYPNLIKTENETRIYYSGISSPGEFFKIGFVRKIGE